MIGAPVEEAVSVVEPSRVSSSAVWSFSYFSGCSFGGVSRKESLPVLRLLSSNHLWRCTRVPAKERQSLMLTQGQLRTTTENTLIIRTEGRLTLLTGDGRKLRPDSADGSSIYLCLKVDLGLL